MKRIKLSLILLGIIALGSCSRADKQVQTEAMPPEQEAYFQLKIYHLDTSEQEALLDWYFQDALLPALHRTGIEHVGVFKPIAGLSEQKDIMMVLIPFESLEEFEELPDILLEDQEYQQAGKDYIEAPFDSPPYARIESIILRAFSSEPHLMLPELSSPRPERVYELRSYESATEKLHQLKVEMFNDGESALFHELNFNPVFFGDVLSSSYMPHLMYMTAHADTTAQKANWEAFGVNPEWERMRDMARYQNTVSKITRYLLYPTDYSDY
jgi:hypothetical protein